ncbi:hypothetical protein [Capnocytophaga felis]|uniref:hypothetical protein n=1 Tax=Capnocytophaga felis TaxID=2267611 RepID=UPI0012D32AFD|nr:hypothetical protein [Capnocytophaga felis]
MVVLTRDDVYKTQCCASVTRGCAEVAQDGAKVTRYSASVTQARAEATKDGARVAQAILWNVSY